MGYAASVGILDLNHERHDDAPLKNCSCFDPQEFLTTHMESTRMSNEIRVELICKSSVGKDLTLGEGRVLGSVMGVRHLKNGELLSKEGEVSSTLFILVEGQLDLYGDKEGKSEVRYTMSKGECAGTRAFIDRSTRKATLVAHGDATVYTLEPDAFETLIDSNPRIIYKVMSALFRNTHTNLIRMNREAEQLSNYINKSQGRY
jgi:signal-transduction protein with cAMP-binding, CBS, and nucleotidyltransferase domain